MTKVLERPKVPDRPPELWIEPPVRKVPLPEKKEAAPPPEKKVAAPKQTGRWIRWMIVALVLAMATSVAFLALRDSGSDVVGTSHPLAEVYVVDATGTSHPLAEINVG